MAEPTDKNEPPYPEEAARAALANADAAQPIFHVELMGAGSMRIYQVLEQDLRSLQGTSEREALLLAFFCLCSGALISALFGWLGLGAVSAMRSALYLAATITLSVLSALLGLLWKSERAGRIKALKAILDGPGGSKLVNVPASRG